MLVGLLPVALAASAPPFWPHFGGDREVTVLDGTWQYGLNEDPSFDSMGAIRTSELPTPNTTAVPSTMDAALPGYPGARGVGIYRTQFKQAGAARLQFMSCSFYCRVFVDGKAVADSRSGGYTPFWVDLPNSTGDRELVVLADNRFNATTAPLHTGGDFWMYGGLIRSVLLHDMPDDGQVWPWRAHVFPTSLSEIDLNITLSDPTRTGPVNLTLQFDTSSAPQPVQGQAHAGVVTLRKVAVPSPRVWGIRKPELHTVAVTVDGGTVVERFGLRQWGQKGNRLTVNGEVVKLHGWNHHTQWPDTGATPTEEQMDGDIRLLLEAGTTYVRGAHYPQDQRWLDRLDEAGLAMWEETLGPSTSESNLKDWDYFMKHQLAQLDQMIDQSLNHASIMIWAWFNEGPSDKSDACPAYQACSERARATDPTRFVTWASNKEDNDKCLDHATLISFNSYPAWYYKTGDLKEPKEHWDSMAAYVKAHQAGKPFAISETGAGGVYEWSHNSTDAKWTTKYQTEIIAADVDAALDNDDLSAITLWHFFDFKGNDDATKKCGPCQYVPGVSPPTCAYVDVTCDRPGGLNHKGVVDFWRRKKEAYSVVAEKYNRTSAGRVVVV